MRSNKLIDLVGNTPILKWDNLYLKMEMFNPSGSIKDRPATFMLDRLIKNGIINEHDTVICPTSGNMGISLAYFGKIFKVNIIIVMPDNMSSERKNIIKALGAKLILTNSFLGMEGSIKKARELANNNGYYYFDQFDSMLNVVSHYKTLLEIINEIPDTDYIVCGIGTGGTYIGLKQMANKLKLNTQIIGVEPSNLGLITKCISKEPILISDEENGVPGISSNSISNIIKRNIIDVSNIVMVSPKEVYENFYNLIETGLNIGISGAGSVLVARRLQEKYTDKKIVVIIPDGIDRYYSELNV